jgi:multicomponent Na+:H+ antiporter subunit F
MNLVFLSAAGALLATILVGLAQVFRQPGRADSLLAVLLFGTTGVALVLLMGRGLGMQRASDIALVFALLGAVLAVAFVARGWPNNTQREEEERAP